jgi:hypothetical protein
MHQLLRQRTVQALLLQFKHSKNSSHTSAEQRWDLLCAAHIAGQSILRLHIQTHLAMLGLAAQERNAPEVLGQLMRLALVPIGHLAGKLPFGNSGRANVSAFQPMPIHARWQSLIDQAQRGLGA